MALEYIIDKFRSPPRTCFVACAEGGESWRDGEVLNSNLLDRHHTMVPIRVIPISGRGVWMPLAERGAVPLNDDLPQPLVWYSCVINIGLSGLSRIDSYPASGELILV